LSKTASLLTVFFLWAGVLLFPVQTLQHVTCPIGPYTVPVYYLILALPAAVLIGRTLWTHPPRTLVDWGWWAVPLSCVPGVLFGVDRMWGGRQLVSFVLRGAGIAACLAGMIRTADEARLLTRWLYIVGSIICLYGICEVVFDANPLADHYAEAGASASPALANPLYQSPAGHSGSNRPMGTQGNRIPYAACLVPFIPVALWQLHSDSKNRWLHGIAAAALFGLVSYSQVRSSWVGMSAGLIAYAALSPRLQSRWLLIGTGAVISLLLLFAPSRHRLVDRAQSFTRTNRDILHRTGSWPTVKALRGRALSGVGYGNYIAVYRPYYTGPFAFLPTPDNQYLRWLIENGLIGAVTLAAVLIGLARRTLKTLMQLGEPDAEFYLAVWVAWFSMAVTFLFFDGFYWIGPNMTFWCLLGILSSCLRRFPARVSP
jgi:O-antigen ligase